MASSTSMESMSVLLPDGKGIKTGGSRRIRLTNGHEVWSKHVALQNGQRSRYPPLLLLHGGPGGNSVYFECFEDFLPRNGIEFYYLDQLDSHCSDQPKDPKLWTIEQYVDQVEQVRKAWGLDKVILLGHSWGGILTYESCLKYQNDGHIVGAVICNMEPSIDDMLQHIDKVLRPQLPPEAERYMREVEARKDWKDERYQHLTTHEFYTRFLCRRPYAEWPEPIHRSFRFMSTPIYEHFQGDNEMVVTGTMAGWSVKDRLKDIKVKTLVMATDNDTMSPDGMRFAASNIPNARLWMGKGGHFSFYDSQDSFFQALIPFVKELAL